MAQEAQKSIDVIYRGVKFNIPAITDKTTVGELKNKIKTKALKLIKGFKSEAEGVENEHLLLKKDECSGSVDNQRLRDDKQSLGDMFGEHQSRLLMTVEEAMGITLDVPNDKVKHALFVFPSDSIDKIYFAAYKLVHKFWFNIYKVGAAQKPLDRRSKVENTLANCDELVVKEDYVRSGGSMELFIKQLTGGMTTLDVSPNEKVSDLKWAVRCTEDVPVDKQRLIYAGMQLDDRKSLTDYKVPKNATMHLILRLSGS